jgi:hypothetical protein
MRPWLIWFLAITMTLAALQAYSLLAGGDTILGRFIYMLHFNAKWALFMPVMTFGAAILGLPAIPPAVVLWRALRHRPAQPEPQCGKCGYTVRGISSMTCPECGSNLREVGVVTAPLRNVRVFKPLRWSIGWLVAVIPLALAASCYVLMMYGPYIVKQSIEYRFSCQAPTLKTIVLAEAKSTCRRTGYNPTGMSAPLQELVMSIQEPLSSPIHLHVDLRSLQCWMTGQNGQVLPRVDGFDDKAIRAWLMTAGVDLSRSDVPLQTGSRMQLPWLAASGTDDVQSDVTMVTGYIATCTKGIFGLAPGSLMTSLGPGRYSFNFAPVSQKASYDLEWWAVPVCVGFWFLIWLSGLWVVLWRRCFQAVVTAMPEDHAQ